MKSVLLIRHAKSSWNFDVADFDRPLNDRGKSDAPDMAERLLKKGVKIDAFISSPAKRAVSTANAFAEVYSFKVEKLITIPSLYEAVPEVFLKVIENLDDEYKRIAIFSHNPGITAFANQLTATQIDDMPTCSVFAIKADTNIWKNFNSAKKSFWFFDYPKAI